MLAPPLPNDETRRLASLRSLGVLDTPAEERFDRLTRIAAAVFDVPIVAVSLVDEKRQWFKSRIGLQVTETPRDISFCGHAILNSGVCYVPNAPVDPRFEGNPLVTGEPNIRFYAGCPLRSPDGSALGTLCIIAPEPRTLSDAQMSLLRDLAKCVEQELWQARLEEALKRIQHLERHFDSSSELLAVIDDDARLLDLNPAWTAATGLAKSELVDRKWTEILRVEEGPIETLEPAPDRSRAPHAFTARLNTHQVERTYLISRTRDEHDGLWHLAARDVTATLAARADAERLALKYQHIFQFAPDAILCVQADGRVVEANAEAVRLLRRPVEQLLGITLDALLVPPKPGAATRPWNDLLARAMREVQEVIIQVPSGDVTVEIRAAVLAGEHIYTVRLRDLSEFHRLEQSKHNFIAAVSHELRTPLTAMMGGVSLIREGACGEVSAGATQMLAIVAANCSRLNGLVGQILDIERLSSGAFGVTIGDVDVSALLRDACAQHMPLAARSNVEIVFGASGDALVVQSDHERLMQVVANLLSNACKFSPPGSRVEVSCAARQGGVRLAVRDHGPGIAEDFKARIFGRFSQSEAGKSKQGAGLGLYISKAVVETLGGELGYENLASGGCEFYLNLPLPRSIALVEDRSGG